MRRHDDFFSSLWITIEAPSLHAPLYHLLAPHSLHSIFLHFKPQKLLPLFSLLSFCPPNTLSLLIASAHHFDVNNSIKVVDLIPGGRNIAVTDETKAEYIRLVAHHRMTAAIRSQVSNCIFYSFYDDISSHGLFLWVHSLTFDTLWIIFHPPSLPPRLSQIEAFLDGFYEQVPPELISIFSPTELELVICGLPDVDVDELYANTEYHQYR